MVDHKTETEREREKKVPSSSASTDAAVLIQHNPRRNRYETSPRGEGASALDRRYPSNLEPRTSLFAGLGRPMFTRAERKRGSDNFTVRKVGEGGGNDRNRATVR